MSQVMEQNILTYISVSFLFCVVKFDHVFQVLVVIAK